VKKIHICAITLNVTLILTLRYDHLAKVLNRLLTERPVDAVDVFEDVSRQEKKEKFVNKVDTLIDKPDRSKETLLAEIQRNLFMVCY
jgi:radial spoke head protein 4A